MNCFVKPYEGDQEYIFFSYCHDDAERIFPIVERLAIEGFHVWFDDGIHPGEEWPDVIARQMSGAKVCVAAVSRLAAESHNCRNELSFALANNKPLLSVILEEFQMPLGMQLQLSGSRYIRSYEEDEETFYSKLLSSPVLAPCRTSGPGADAGALRLWKQHAALYAEKPEAGAEAAVPENRNAWFPGKQNAAENVREKAPVPPVNEFRKESPDKLQPAAESREEPAEAAEFRKEPEEELSPADDSLPTVLLEEDDERTILTPREEPGDEDDRTVLGSRYNPALLLRIRTGEVFPVKRDVTVLGRTTGKADIVFPDNREISGKHAEIWKKRNGFALHNLRPTNETMVDGAELQAEQTADLRPCSEILLADEQFFFIFGEAYDRVFDEQKLCLLKSVDTGETKLLAEDVLPLDRKHKWRGDVLGDPFIHRSGHAEIYRDHGRICLRDLGSRHGTFLNGRQLEANTGVELHDSDRISVVNTEFIYYECRTGA